MYKYKLFKIKNRDNFIKANFLLFIVNFIIAFLFG